MTQINRLSTLDKLGPGDQIPVFDTSNGDARKASVSTLLAYMQDALMFAKQGSYVAQYASPTATGFTVRVADGGSDTSDVHLILTPSAAYASGTIVLPPATKSTAGQEVLVNCTQQISSLVVGANGATAVRGAPSSLAADTYFRLKFVSNNQTWYRVG